MLSGMSYTDFAIARVRAYLKDFGIAKSRLAKMADVPEGCTRQMFTKGWNPTTDTLRKLESVIPPDYQHDPSKPSRKR